MCLLYGRPLISVSDLSGCRLPPRSPLWCGLRWAVLAVSGGESVHSLRTERYDCRILPWRRGRLIPSLVATFLSGLLRLIPNFISTAFLFLLFVRMFWDYTCRYSRVCVLIANCSSAYRINWDDYTIASSGGSVLRKLILEKTRWC